VGAVSVLRRLYSPCFTPQLAQNEPGHFAPHDEQNPPAGVLMGLAVGAGFATFFFVVVALVVVVRVVVVVFLGNKQFFKTMSAMKMPTARATWMATLLGSSGWHWNVT